MRSSLLSLVSLALLASTSSVAHEPSRLESQSPSKLDIQIEALGIDEASAPGFTQAVLEEPKVRERLRGIRYRVLSAHFTGPENRDDPKSEDPQLDPSRPSDDLGYTISIYDYSNAKAIAVTGNFARGGVSEIEELDEQPNPSQEEFEEAVALLAQDPRFGAQIKEGRVRTYDPMPPLVDLRVSPDERMQRIVTVGMMSDSNSADVANEIVGVSLHSGEVIRFPGGAPSNSLATRDHCGYPNAYQAVSRRGTPGTATVTVSREGTQLWKFTVIRPAASSGAYGSAIELKNVYYRGRKVFSQAHVPILNVQYAQNRCGPYRDWQYSESPFEAFGTDIASGIRRASAAPRTIFESGSDRGNFRGVAIHDDGSKVSLTTELSAGWYRYINEFTFHEDGTIEPVFKFSAVQNSCVCNRHNHHVYWRFDFDIDSRSPNIIESYNGASWSRLTREIKQYRDGSARAWRISNPGTGAGYLVSPGPNDGTADAYGRGDAWSLMYRQYQTDDSRVRTSTQANLDAFVTGDTLVNTDVVFWYAGHFIHDTGDSEHAPHIVGPILKPINWDQAR